MLPDYDTPLLADVVLQDGCITTEAKATLLKITTEEAIKEVTLRLEGRVAGPWVNEFQQAWRSLATSLGTRKLVVDLRGVTHMDADGRQVLAAIYKDTGAHFMADTPMITYFAEEAKSQNREQQGEVRRCEDHTVSR